MFIFDILCLLLLTFMAGFAGLALAILVWYIAFSLIDYSKPPRKYR